MQTLVSDAMKLKASVLVLIWVVCMESAQNGEIDGSNIVQGKANSVDLLSVT